MSEALSTDETIRWDLSQIEYTVDFELAFEFPDNKVSEIARRATEYLEERKNRGELKGYGLTWVGEGLVISFTADDGEESSFTVTYSSLV
jgi:hypothetical protein